MKLFSPKPSLPFLLVLLSISITAQSQNAWINEFHYDNLSSDQGEFVEIVLQDAESYDLSMFTLQLYNGSDAEPYGSLHSLDTFNQGVTQNGFTVYFKNISGLQNGPDGLSLDYQGNLIQFISYEGAFTGQGGPADGELSQNIGVAETTSTPVGESLQLSGNGSEYIDFSWQQAAPETKGELNLGQDFSASCTAPSIGANFFNLVAEDIANNQMDLSWSRGNGDRVIIIAKEATPVDAIPENGISYAANNDLSSGLADEIGIGNFVVYDGVGTSALIDGLSSGTEYHFSIFEYFTADHCYLIDFDVVSATTTTNFDQDSKILAPSAQVPAKNISSLANAAIDAVEVIKFDVFDLATSDDKSTFLNKIVIQKNEENTVADWSSVIKGAKLNDGSLDIAITELIVNEDNLEFDLTGNEYEIANGSSAIITISIWLEEIQMDEQILAFEIPENHGFDADANGSLFRNTITSSIKSEVFTIDVEASDFEIVTAASAQINKPFSFLVSAIDANGNIDLASRNVSLDLNLGSGILNSASVGISILAMTAGVYEWTDLEYDVEESISVSVSDGNGLTANSSEISIIPVIESVFFSEYVEGGGSNKALEIFNNSGGTINLNDFSVAIYTNGSQSISFEYELSEIQTELEDQDNLVIVNTSANLELKERADVEQFSITNFNGDDAIALLYQGSVIDLIGEIGVDPGSAWDVAGVPEATENKTLVRKASVSKGNANDQGSLGNNIFNSEWVVYSEDEYSFVGDHFRCEAPNEQVSDISIEKITENSVELEWIVPSGLETIVLLKSNTDVDTEPVSGFSYAADSNFLTAQELGSGNKVIFSGSGNNVTLSELSEGTTYHLAFYVYTANCYNLLSPVYDSFTTRVTLDQDSEINNLSQPSVSKILSTADQEVEAVDVFNFEIADLASNDTLPTLIRKMVLESTDMNSFSWNDTLNAILKDQNGKIDHLDLTITADRIEIFFETNNAYEIPSGESVVFTLAVWLNRFKIQDTVKFGIQIPAVHEFETLETGSSITEIIRSAVTSNVVQISEAFDSIKEIRNGTNGTKYVTQGFTSSQNFGVGATEFYIQNDESMNYENGLAVFSAADYISPKFGTNVKIVGRRGEEEGKVFLNADTIIVLDEREHAPRTEPISIGAFNLNSDLIGSRVRLDSLFLIQPELWNNLNKETLPFSDGSDTIFVKIKPNNIYYSGMVQTLLGAVDLAGIMENHKDSIHLLITMDNEITDPYPPNFEKEPEISNIESESINVDFIVDELCTVYYLVKEAGHEVASLDVFKNPELDQEVSSSGAEKIDLAKVGKSISIRIPGLEANTDYSFFVVLEDSLANVNEISKFDFSTIRETADKDVQVGVPQEQIASKRITILEGGQQYQAVFNFSVADAGTRDGLPALLNQMAIHSSKENEINYSEFLEDVQLFDLSQKREISTENKILPDSIVFKLEESFVIDDGQENDFQIWVKMKERIPDGLKLAFEIPSTLSNWEVAPEGSQLVEQLEDIVVSNTHQVDVIGSKLTAIFPKEVYVNESFNIGVAVQDKNGNIDTDERTISIITDSAENLNGKLEIDLLEGEGIFQNLSFEKVGLYSFKIIDGNITEIIKINFIEPEIKLDTSDFITDFGPVYFPEESDIRSYEIAVENLKDSVVVEASDGFQLSLNPGFENSSGRLIINFEDDNSKKIFVKFVPSEIKGRFYNGNISHYSQGANIMHLGVKGQEGTLFLEEIRAVKERALGERVKVHGVVIGGKSYFETRRIIQDQTAGIAVEGLNSVNLDFGDSVEVEGVLSEIDEWLTIIPEKEVTKLSADSIWLQAVVVEIKDLNDSIELQRIRIEGLTIAADGKFEAKNYAVFNPQDGDTLSVRLNANQHPLIGRNIPFEQVNIMGFMKSGREKASFYIELVEDLEVIPRDTVIIIEAPELGLNFEDVLVDEYSEPNFYKLFASNLAEDLMLTASEDYEISLLKNTNYKNNLILPANQRGDIPEIKIYVRFAPKNVRGGLIEGEIVHRAGAQEVRLPLSGKEVVIARNDFSLNNEIKIYPNPVKSKLAIEMEKSGDYQYKLKAVDGKVLKRGYFEKNQSLNLASFAKGVFILQIKSLNELFVCRIIKE